MSHATNDATDGLTAELASFIHSRPVPDGVRDHARQALATALPLAVGAIDQDAPARVLRLAERIGGTPTASVPGTAVRTNPVLAALVAGTAANSDDFDDTDLRTFAHPSASVVPAALAVAEHLDADLAQLLDAIAIGNEVATRIGRAFGPAHVERGWHISSTSNQLGAVAAAAALLGLDQRATRRALGIAATQVAGLGAALGSMAKPFHFGKAASNGVEAALLAGAGLTAPERGLEGRRGLLPVVAPHADAAAIVAGLGARWDCLEIQAKPYPCGFVSHPLIDAAVELSGLVGDPATVTVLRAHVHPTSLDFMDRPEPDSVLQAKLSLQFCAAAAVVRGRFGLGEFTEDAVQDPLVRQVMARVELVGDRATPESAALTAVAGDDHYEVEVAAGRGTPERPLTGGEVEAKGVESAARTLGTQAADRLVRACLTGPVDMPVRDLVAAATLSPA